MCGLAGVFLKGGVSGRAAEGQRGTCGVWRERQDEMTPNTNLSRWEGEARLSTDGHPRFPLLGINHVTYARWVGMAATKQLALG